MSESVYAPVRGRNVVLPSIGIAVVLAICAGLALPWGSAQAALVPVPGSPIGGPGTAESQFVDPAGLAVNAATGDVYVADTGNHRIQRFADDGTFEVAFGWGVDDGTAALQSCTSGCEAGIEGGGEGQLSGPTGIGVDAATGDVFVADAGNARIVRYSAAGSWIDDFPMTGTMAPNTGNLAVSAGRVFVSTDNSLVSVFDTAGTPLPALDASSFRPLGASLMWLSALAADASGRVYVIDSQKGVDGARIFVFDPAGNPERTLRPLAFDDHSPTSIAVDPQSGDVFEGIPNVGADYDYDFDVTQYDSAGAIRNEHTAQGAVGAATGSGFNPGAAFPGFGPGALYLADTQADRLVIVAPLMDKPAIKSVRAEDVGTDDATLKATVNPNLGATTYHVEYGTTEAYGTQVPSTSEALGDSADEQRVTARLTGLAPGTRYHYRVVATNPRGTTVTPDRTFTTDAVDAPVGLPDGRVYEQVSPVDKSDNEPHTPDSTGVGPTASIAAPAGGAIAYAVVGGWPGSDASTRFNVARSVRTAADWTTRMLDPLIPPPDQLAAGSVRAVSADVSHTVVTSRAALTPDAVAGQGHLYLRDNATGAHTLMAAHPNPNFGDFGFPVVGGSTDFSHVLIAASEALTPDATEGVETLYEWSRERGLERVPGADGTGSGNQFGFPMSDDGRRFAFRSGGALYVREDGERTIPVSVSQRAGDPATPQPGEYFGLSRDGTKVVFAAAAPLTEDADPEDLDVYRYDLVEDELVNLSAGIERGAPGDPESVDEVIGVSADAMTVYFGLASRDPVTGVRSSPRALFVSRGGAQQALVDSDAIRAAVSPNGRYLVLRSREPLTDADLAGHAQLFRYDADAQRFDCVSCKPSGAPSTAPANTDTDSNALAEFGHLRSVLDDGRVFFETRDPLVPQDVNHRQDVYQWHAGRPALISDGQSRTDSYFADASASGEDVFFTTRARLVGQDRDDYVDMYTARVAGGLPGQHPAPATTCVGEACQGPAPAPPALPLAASITFADAGNLPIRRISVRGRRTVRGTRASLRVTVPARGRIVASGGSIRRVRRTAAKAGTQRLRIELTTKAKRALRKRARLRVRVTVRFDPATGPTTTAAVALTFRKGR